MVLLLAMYTLFAFLYSAPKMVELISCDPHSMSASFRNGHGARGAKVHTAKKPLMKLLGNLALGSSSARKYFRTWDSCFQKLRVS